MSPRLLSSQPLGCPSGWLPRGFGAKEPRTDQNPPPLAQGDRAQWLWTRSAPWHRRPPRRRRPSQAPGELDFCVQPGEKVRVGDPAHCCPVGCSLPCSRVGCRRLRGCRVGGGPRRSGRLGPRRGALSALGQCWELLGGTPALVGSGFGGDTGARWIPTARGVKMRRFQPDYGSRA